MYRIGFGASRLQSRSTAASHPRVGSTVPAGYNGDVATLFVPIEAQRVYDARLILTHIDPQRVTLATGRRNWPAIREAAEQSIHKMLAASVDPVTV